MELPLRVEKEESRRLDPRIPESGVCSVGMLLCGSCQGRGAGDVERIDPDKQYRI
ncbi:MAG TPA: hypothetical protein VGN15_13230 [Ktedonobacteraceae bacterium]|nr:hypothetical protein [Ktedonobacteraceae bacterium]